MACWTGYMGAAHDTQHPLPPGGATGPVQSVGPHRPRLPPPPRMVVRGGWGSCPVAPPSRPPVPSLLRAWPRPGLSQLCFWRPRPVPSPPAAQRKALPRGCRDLRRHVHLRRHRGQQYPQRGDVQVPGGAARAAGLRRKLETEPLGGGALRGRGLSGARAEAVPGGPATPLTGRAVGPGYSGT